MTETGFTTVEQDKGQEKVRGIIVSDLYYPDRKKPHRGRQAPEIQINLISTNTAS
jgi:hypothetical protein